MADLVVINLDGSENGESSAKKINLSIMAVNALNNTTLPAIAQRVTVLEQSGGGGGPGVTPADQKKLDAVSIVGPRYQIDMNQVYLGAGTDGVEVIVDNKLGTNSVFGGNKSGGAWMVGNFPNSQIHPDDLVLENPQGGVFASISDAAKFSVRYGTEVVSFTKAELKKVKAGWSLAPADKTKLDFISATKAANLDTMVDNIQVAFNRIAALGLDASGTNLMSTKEIELLAAQVVSNDPAVAGKDNRLMTIASVVKALGELKTVLSAPREEYELTGAAPKMRMKIDAATGVGANMEVLFGTQQVATMQWDKLTEEFGFTLFDKTSGAVKASFAIKKDGKAYVGGKSIATEDRVEELIHEYRQTIDLDTAGATPTKVECITAFKHLAHFDWKQDDDFYIRQVDRSKMHLIKYRALPSSVDEATAGEFWIEALSKAK